MILLYILAGVLVLLVILLAAPITVDFTYNNQQRLKKRMQFIWLYGLVNTDLQSPSDKKADLKSNVASAKPAKKIKKSGKEKSKIPLIITLLQSEGFIKRFFRLLRELIALLDIADSYLKLRFGLDDPADTGRLWGYLSPFTLALNACSQTKFTVFPTFEHSAFEADIHFKLRIIPIKFIWVVLQFMFSKEAFKAFKSVSMGNKI